MVYIYNGIYYTASKKEGNSVILQHEWNHSLYIHYAMYNKLGTERQILISHVKSKNVHLIETENRKVVNWRLGERVGAEQGKRGC